MENKSNISEGFFVTKEDMFRFESDMRSRFAYEQLLCYTLQASPEGWQNWSQGTKRHIAFAKYKPGEEYPPYTTLAVAGVCVCV